MSRFRIFVVEDDPWYGQVLLHHLSLNPDFDVQLFERAKLCLNQLYERPDVVCMDYSLPDMSGDELLSKIKLAQPDLPVVVISGQEDISVAVELLKSGARDYIVKDDHAQDLLWKAILNIRENSDLREEVDALKEQLADKYDFESSIVGNSEALKKTFHLIGKAVRSNINVSITGETGTGKELVAKAIHFNSQRRKKPFIPVNMAAIPSDLLESELFGHEKGAFTGATSLKKGKFEEANGGTLFLDEIGELEIGLQSKILRALQEREVVRVGGTKPIPFDVRLLTATHRDLKEAVREGEFREDLYFRIVGLPLELPPLRQRGKDVLVLANHFIKEYARTNKASALSLSKEARDALMGYNYPGNVRELKAVIDLACVMCENSEILEADLIFHNIRTSDFFTAKEKTLREYNADIVSFYLDKYNQNVVEVARKLGVGKSTIYNMIKNGELPTRK